MIAFRFVHCPAGERDFLPVGAIGEPKPRGTCSRFALSFFATAEAARRKFKILSERIDAAARYGDHIAEISLEEKDGVLSEPNGSGHMDLHEDEGATFANRIASYEPLVEQGRPQEIGEAVDAH